MLFYRGSLHLISLFLPPAEIRRLAGLEPRTSVVRFIKDRPLSYLVSVLLLLVVVENVLDSESLLLLCTYQV